MSYVNLVRRLSGFLLLLAAFVPLSIGDASHGVASSGEERAVPAFAALLEVPGTPSAGGLQSVGGGDGPGANAPEARKSPAHQTVVLPAPARPADPVESRPFSERLPYHSTAPPPGRVESYT